MLAKGNQIEVHGLELQTSGTAEYSDTYLLPEFGHRAGPPFAQRDPLVVHALRDNKLANPVHAAVVCSASSPTYPEHSKVRCRHAHGEDPDCLGPCPQTWQDPGG